MQVLDDWLGHTGGSIGMDRRIFLAVSGAALTAPAWAYAIATLLRQARFTNGAVADRLLAEWGQLSQLVADPSPETTRTAMEGDRG